jgi:sensor c-di-GMP phosphodiesterase-like protein
MNRSARRKMLRVVGIIMVVMLPVMLALWFAQLRAVSETSAQLRTFAELALDKTELVIQQVELARTRQKNIRASFVRRTSSIYVERCSWSPVCRRFNLR